MATSTIVPVAYVKKMKHGKGINPIKDQIEKDFSIGVEFDGNERLELKGEGHLTEIAFKRLERKYGDKVKEDPIVDVEDGKVVWRFSEEASFILTKLYKEEIQSIPNVSLAPSPPTPSWMLVLTCKRTDVSKEALSCVNRLAAKVGQVEREELDVRKKTKAAKEFCEQNDTDYCTCKYDEKTKKIIFIGRDKMSVQTLKDKYNSTSKKKENTNSPVPDDKKENKKNHADAKPKNKTAFVEPATLNESQTNKNQKQSDQQASISKPRVEVGDEEKSATGKVPPASIPGSGAVPKNTIGHKPQSSPSSNDGRGQPHRPPNGQIDRGTASPNPQDIVGPATNNRNQYEFPVGRVKVLVYKQSITDIKKMDAIVNAANERMAHGGGIAFYISKAAGSTMDMECNMYVQKKGPLPVSEVYTSKPGKMKCKGILHAVGPRWSEYIGKEDQCARDLYTTVYRCLKTMDEHRWRYMALCAISSGIFGVPKPLCTAMYLKAIEDFATKHPGTHMEVHFIDVVQDILDQMIQTHQERMRRGFSPGFDMAFKFPSAKQGYWEGKGKRRDKGYEQGQGRGQYDRGPGQYGGQGGAAYQNQTPRRPPDEGGQYEVGYPNQTPRSSHDEGHVRGKQNLYPDLTPHQQEAGYGGHTDRQEEWKEYIPEKMGDTNIDIDQFCKSTTDAPKEMSLKIKPQAWGISEGYCEYHQKKQAVKQFPCNHKYCIGCFTNSKDGCQICTAASKNKKPEPKTTVVELGAEQTCPICMDAFEEPAILKCGHQFCKGCLKSAAAEKPLCPTCKLPFGVVMGIQPDGHMFVRTSASSLPGYEQCGRIEIMYHFEDGKQKGCHPNPGRSYKGIKRTGYLPDNAEGQRVLRLFKTAFSRRLIFTIGESRTTGHSGQITWNDIHHKTALHGDKFSYPDPSYLTRVQEELAANGVTE